MKNILMIHGFSANSKDHWFPWLKKEAAPLGYNVICPDMPNSSNPSLDLWLNELDKFTHYINNDSWVVGHSLGCITALRFLHKIKLHNLPKGIILVSGFSRKLPIWEGVDSISDVSTFTENNFDFNFTKNIKNKYMIGSLNDDIVPYELTIDLNEKLKSIIILFPDRGHFLSRDNIFKLPIILNIISDDSFRKKFNNI